MTALEARALSGFLSGFGWPGDSSCKHLVAHDSTDSSEVSILDCVREAGHIESTNSSGW